MRLRVGLRAVMRGVIPRAPSRGELAEFEGPPATRVNGLSEAVRDGNLECTSSAVTFHVRTWTRDGSTYNPSSAPAHRAAGAAGGPGRLQRRPGSTRRPRGLPAHAGFACIARGKRARRGTP
eukprot:scaffold58972_cov63-Phaeocystis_antarctica.AAC.3